MPGRSQMPRGRQGVGWRKQLVLLFLLLSLTFLLAAKGDDPPNQNPLPDPNNNQHPAPEAAKPVEQQPPPPPPAPPAGGGPAPNVQEPPVAPPQPQPVLPVDNNPQQGNGGAGAAVGPPPVAPQPPQPNLPPPEEKNNNIAGPPPNPNNLPPPPPPPSENANNPNNQDGGGGAPAADAIPEANGQDNNNQAAPNPNPPQDNQGQQANGYNGGAVNNPPPPPPDNNKAPNNDPVVPEGDNHNDPNAPPPPPEAHEEENGNNDNQNDHPPPPPPPPAKAHDEGDHHDHENTPVPYEAHEENDQPYPENMGDHGDNDNQDDGANHEMEPHDVQQGGDEHEDHHEDHHDEGAEKGDHHDEDEHHNDAEDKNHNDAEDKNRHKDHQDGDHHDGGENQNKNHHEVGGDHLNDHGHPGEEEWDRKRWDDVDAHQAWNDDATRQKEEEKKRHEEEEKRKRVEEEWQHAEEKKRQKEEEKRLHKAEEEKRKHDLAEEKRRKKRAAGQDGDDAGGPKVNGVLKPDGPVPDIPASPTLVMTNGGLVASADPLVMEDGRVILAFKGIPYAQPPIESLRWLPPQPMEGWDGVFSGAEFGNDCVQVEGWGSEDCLYVNVWTPAEAVRMFDEDNNEPKLPVLVYVHGGGLMSGSGSSPMDHLVWKAGPEGNGIVAVSLNYRLNIFGFLTTDDLSKEQQGMSGNYGIMDQQMALRWVQDNIEAFGGDPNRVTIMGQSSGGTSIYALLSSPESKGLFHRAIALSGSPNMTMDGRTAERRNAKITSVAGCGRYKAWEARLACMRIAPVGVLVSAIPYEWTMPTMWELPDDKSGKPYPGLVVVDGRVVTYPFFKALEKGVVDVPLLFGNMAEEGDMSFPGEQYKELNSKKEADWKKFLTKKFKPFGPKAGEVVYQAYRQDFLKEGPRKGYDAIIADTSMTCGHLKAARAALAGGRYKSPLWLYVNAWAPTSPVDIGGAQCTYAFHTWDYVNGFDVYHDFEPSESDLAHGAFLRKAWYELTAKGVIPSGIGWLPIQAVSTSRSLKGKGKPTGKEVDPKSIPVFLMTSTSQKLIAGYKAAQCEALEKIGIDQRFWWTS